MGKRTEGAGPARLWGAVVREELRLPQGIPAGRKRLTHRL
jgi:hypothetical protein